MNFKKYKSNRNLRIVVSFVSNPDYPIFRLSDVGSSHIRSINQDSTVLFQKRSFVMNLYYIFYIVYFLIAIARGVDRGNSVIFFRLSPLVITNEDFSSPVHYPS